MGGLFSKKKSSQPDRISEHDKAVLSLKHQRDKLKQYQKKISLNLEKEREVAKQLLKDGKKGKAKLLLKKKRYQENLLKKTDGQLENIQTLISEVEFKQIEMKVYDGLKKGNEALKQLNQLMSVEDVEKIIDNTKEAVEYQNEITELITGRLTDEDEDDVMKELESLISDSLPDVPMNEHEAIEDKLPEVPLSEPQEVKQDEITRKTVQEGVFAM